MQDQRTDTKRIRPNDFPELQVGFPERNDVANPNIEMERIDVDLQTLGISKKTAEEMYGKSGRQEVAGS